jgi:hypothetical protein
LNSRPPRFLTGALHRSNACLHHTGIFLQRESAARVFSAALPTELQQRSLLAGIEPATVGLVDVTRAFATLQILAAGISSSGFLSDALPLSYSNSRHRWESNPRLSEPDVTRAFTTPQTRIFFVTSLLRCVFTSSFVHTRSVTLRSELPSATQRVNNFREESALTGFRVSNPRLSAFP